MKDAPVGEGEGRNGENGRSAVEFEQVKCCVDEVYGPLLSRQHQESLS